MLKDLDPIYVKNHTCNLCNRYVPDDWHIFSIDICDECHDKRLCAKCGEKIEDGYMNYKCKRCEKKFEKVMEGLVLILKDYHEGK